MPSEKLTQSMYDIELNQLQGHYKSKIESCEAKLRQTYDDFSIALSDLEDRGMDAGIEYI